MNLTPRVKELLERTTQSATKAKKSAEKTKKAFPSPLKLNLKLDAGKCIESSKQSLTARFEKLLRKTELLATVALEANETNDETRYGAEGHFDNNEEENYWVETHGTIRHEDEISSTDKNSLHKWERRFDTEYHGTPENPIPYFYDEITGVSQWEVPKDFEEYGEESHLAWTKHHENKENETMNGPFKNNNGLTA